MFEDLFTLTLGRSLARSEDEGSRPRVQGYGFAGFGAWHKDHRLDALILVLKSRPSYPELSGQMLYLKQQPYCWLMMQVPLRVLQVIKNAQGYRALVTRNIFWGYIIL